MPPKQGSVEVGPPAAQGEGRARRYYKTPEALVERPCEEVRVLADILTRCVKQFGDANAVGWRETIRMVKEVKEVVKDGEVEKKEWFYYELGEYQWWSFRELAAKVKAAGSALVAMGHSKDTIFNIYSATNPRWQVMANACASQSITFATAYDSLGEEGLEHSLNEPSVFGLFTNANLLGMLASVISRTPTLKVLIYDGPADAVKKGALETIAAANGGIQIFTFDEFLALGKSKPAEPNHPKPEDTACIMYTSGSTGPPKGVMLSNANIVASIGGVDILLSDALRGGIYLAFLPLAHILEFTVELYALSIGVQLGYASIKTLTNANVRNCEGDIRALRPTAMVGVPAVWELIRKGIIAKVKASGPVSSTIFNLALSIKKFTGNNSIIGNVLDSLVFKSVKDATGGRLKWGVNGGAPLSLDTQEFLSLTLAPIIAGYGMTESTALSAVISPEFFQYGPVGVPVPSCEIKLVDFAEAGYFSTNHRPQGEVWVRGPSVSKGYYKREDLTAEALTPDGWIKTGDIGQWGPDGVLSIIDRKKNLIKLAGGEYVALERLEAVYKNSHVVANLCLHADSSAYKSMAIIYPQETVLRALAAKIDSIDAEADFAHLCEAKEVRKAVLLELNTIGKAAGLRSLEMLQTVVLTPTEWTAANGFLTAAQKLQRKQILAEFHSQIHAIYP